MNYIILLSLFFLISCEKNGIMKGGEYSGENTNFVKTFYIYDYITSKDIIEHSSKVASEIVGESVNYYFSHNANIPTQLLKLAPNHSKAINIVKKYSSNLKYVVSINKNNNLIFFDCSVDTISEFCGPY